MSQNPINTKENADVSARVLRLGQPFNPQNFRIGRVLVNRNTRPHILRRLVNGGAFAMRNMEEIARIGNEGPNRALPLGAGGSGGEVNEIARHFHNLAFS